MRTAMAVGSRVTVTRREEETIDVARTLASQLEAGAVVLLHGDLGAGKTVFVRGLAEGLGADPADVSSPTFTICQRYDGRVTLHHVDLYRLTPAEVDDLGLDEIVAGDGITAIEWPDRLVRLPARTVDVWLDDAGGDVRRVRIEPPRDDRRHSTR